MKSRQVKQSVCSTISIIFVADVFESEVEHTIAQITKLIEPLILVVLGGAVVFVLIAIYLPMFMSSGGGA